MAHADTTRWEEEVEPPTIILPRRAVGRLWCRLLNLLPGVELEVETKTYRGRLLSARTWEAWQLAEAFGLEVPDMKRIPGGNDREGDPNAAAVRCGRKLKAIQEPTEHTLRLAGRGPAKLLKARFDEETPTPELLAELEGLEHPEESVTREGDGALVIEHGPDRFRVELSDRAWADATRERDRFLAQDRADDRLALRRFFVRDLDLPREFFDGLETGELRELSEKVDAALEEEGS